MISNLFHGKLASLSVVTTPLREHSLAIFFLRSPPILRSPLSERLEQATARRPINRETFKLFIRRLRSGTKIEKDCISLAVRAL